MAIAAQCSPDSGRDLALNLQLVMQQLLLFISPKLVQTSSKLNLFNGSSFQYAHCEDLIIVNIVNMCIVIPKGQLISNFPKNQ